MQSAAAIASTRSSALRASPFVHRTIESIRSWRTTLNPSSSVGFVPTMGALHEGHLSLVRQAREKNDFVVVSIFVNPTQFGKGEDFSKYPRQLEQDVDALSDLDVDHLFAPNKEDMYTKTHRTFVEPMGFDNNTSEGLSRPGHFRGVATIVTKLFNIVNPTNAYFGRKDATQCCLIQNIVNDLNIPTNVNICETTRESDGLAMSSRNVYLNPVERSAAPILYQSLVEAKQFFYQQIMAAPSEEEEEEEDEKKDSREHHNLKSISSEQLIQTVMSVLQTEPLVNEIQYIAIDDIYTMEPLTEVNKNSNAIISIACKIGNVRLIDNIVL